MELQNDPAGDEINEASAEGQAGNIAGVSPDVLMSIIIENKLMSAFASQAATGELDVEKAMERFHES